MDRNALRDEIGRALAEILDEAAVELTDQTTAASVKGWDSMVHLKLILALEARLGFEFAVREIKAPSNVGELIDLVNGKL